MRVILLSLFTLGTLYASNDYVPLSKISEDEKVSSGFINLNKVSKEEQKVEHKVLTDNVTEESESSYKRAILSDSNSINSYFIGAGLVHGTVNTNEISSGTIVSNGVSSTGTIKDSEKLKDTSFDIKVGTIIEDKHRVYLNYYRLKDVAFNNSLSYSLVSLNYDYLLHSAKTNLFNPYIGVHIGYGKSDFGDFVGNKFKDESSIDYGINIGILKNINKDISLEVGYKYTIVDNKSVLSGTFVDGQGDTLTGSAYQEMEEVKVLNFGINFKF